MMESTARWLPLAAVFTLAWLWLAALPYGGWGGFLAHPARAACVVATFVLLLAAAFADSSGLSAGVREDRANRWIFVPVLGLSVAIGYLPAWCDVRGWLVVDGDTARWLGVAVFSVGGALRLYPVFVLGRRFSGLVAIQPGHTLVTSGVYGLIRHPSYLGLLISVTGWALVFRSLLGIALAAAFLWPLTSRMDAEEALLKEQFGEAWCGYQKRTYRLLPLVY